MTTPLVLQIQEAALDSKSSVTDALRKAKIACVKLELAEFGNWVDLELNGYIGKKVEELPEYRKLHGIPEAFNPYQGWKPIIFSSPEQHKSLSFAPVLMTITAIEDSLRDAKPEGFFSVTYPPEVQYELRMSLNWGDDLRIKLKSHRMKKSKLETAETRRRIVKTAAAEFCRNGIHATGLSDLMAAAGLTHGGFYRHFDSKDQLVAEACAAATVTLGETTDASACHGVGKDALEAIVASYLSTDHRDNPSDGCVLAGLGSELARSDDKTRAAATAGFLKLVDAFAKQYRRTKPETAKARALVAVSAMIGALTMSRIVTDPKLSAAILRHTKKHLTNVQRGVEIRSPQVRMVPAQI